MFVKRHMNDQIWPESVVRAPIADATSSSWYTAAIMRAAGRASPQLMVELFSWAMNVTPFWQG